MRICLYLDRSRVLHWHEWLAEALAALPGCTAQVAFAPESRPLPWSCALLFELERLVYRLKGRNAIDPASAPVPNGIATAGDDATAFDIVVDLAGGDTPLPPGKRILYPRFNGIAGEIGLIAALADKEPLLVELHDSTHPREPWQARPATTDRNVFLQSLDNVLACTVRLIVKAIEQPTPPVPRLAPSVPRLDRPSRSALPPAPRAVTTALGAAAAGALIGKMGRLLGNLASGGKSWAVGWRFTRSRSLLDQRDAAFAIISDDGRRYYADPFPFRHQGRNFVFVEEFPYATGRGCISVLEIGESGSIGPPRPVLEEPHHLSYPFVFELDGEIWMLPEAGESGGIDVYRAEQFPYKWKREARVISGIEAYDSTLLRHRGRLWLFVCERAWKSSSWDMLSLFHADSLTGDWLPHALNPVLLDATLSRPGGAMFAHNGQTIRPVQDCSQIYGGAIELCRLDTLGPQQFSQSPIGRIHAGTWGCHTFNSDGGIELIDVFGRVRGVSDVSAFFMPTTQKDDVELGSAVGGPAHAKPTHASPGSSVGDKEVQKKRAAGD